MAKIGPTGQTRRFGGTQYHIYVEKPKTKTGRKSALSVARRLRGLGDKARVEGSSTTWQVWVA